MTKGSPSSPLSRPAKLSKVHFSRKFQGKMHLNFWLSGSPISPYFHPKNLPIPPKVYLLKVQGTKSKASIDFHCPLWQIPLSSRQLIKIQTLLSPLWSPSRFVLAILHEQAFPKYIFLKQICGIFVLKICFLGMLVYVTLYHYLKCISKFIQQQIFIWW